MPADLHAADGFEGGAHLTLFHQPSQLSFTYYLGDRHVEVSHGGYGEPPVLQLQVPPSWDWGGQGPTLATFEEFCNWHIKHYPEDTR